MNPFSFLEGIGRNIANWLSPHSNENGYSSPGFKNDALYNLQNGLISPMQYDANGNEMNSYDGPVSAPPTPYISKSSIPQQTPTPIPTPTPQPIPTTDTFSRGFNNFAPNVPVASQSGLFSTAAGQLLPGIDKLMPAILSLIETGGGQHMVANSNPFNIAGIQNGKRGFINYPDLSTALLGGPNGEASSSGLVGELNSPIYADYRKSGNLEDFFKHYTPPGPAYGNPSMQQLIERYNLLRNLFTQ